MDNNFKEGQLVYVYDGDLVGFTFASLTKRVDIVEQGVLERWKMLTIEGYELVRFVKNEEAPKKDGSAYIV